MIAVVPCWLAACSSGGGDVGTTGQRPASSALKALETVTAFSTTSVSSPPALDGAVSTGTATATTVTTISFPHTTGSGADRLMLVGIAANSYSTSRTINSVTFTPSGGSATAFSPVGSVQNGNGRLAAIYSLLAPPSAAAGTVAVTFSGSVGSGIVAGAANFKGVDQEAPLDNFASATGSATGTSTSTISLSVPSHNGDLVFDTVFLGSSTPPAVTPDAAQSQLWNSSASRTRGAASTKEAGGATTTMSWKVAAGTANYWAVGGVSINPSGPAIPSGPAAVSASDATYADKVQVSWTASNGADSYQVYRNTSDSSGDSTQIGTSTASPYDDTTATPGTIYYYFVKACNGAVCSGFSTSDSGYRYAAPPEIGDAGPDGAPGAGDATFAEDAPTVLTVTVTSPNTGSESWAYGSVQDVTWDVSNPVSQGAFDMWLVGGDGNWVAAGGAVLAEAGKTHYNASWQVNAPARTDYKLAVYYRPDAGVIGGWTASDLSDNAFAVTPAFVAAGGGRGPLSTTIVTDHTFVDTVPRVKNQTMRVMLRTTAGGSQVAVKLTNRFSSVALPVGAAHVAIRGTGGAIVSGSDRTLTFSGASAVNIPANAEVWSDPAGLAVSRGQTLAISVYVTGNLTPTTESGRGNLSWMTHYLSSTGDHTSDLTMPGTATTHIILFVAEVRVLPARPAATLVTLGDSITEGACSTAPNGDWPDLLSDRLPTLPDGTPVSVFNAGIGSGRFQSSDGAGLRGIKRLPELLALPSVRWVTILMGVNDISYEGAAAADLIAAYQSAISQAHAAGVKVIGIPILPFRHSTKDVGTNWTTAQTVNAWIRAPGNFDAVIDFESVVGDPADPGSMKASLRCSTSDRVHPNQAGYTAMANAIDLAIFH